MPVDVAIATPDSLLRYRREGRGGWPFPPRGSALSTFIFTYVISEQILLTDLSHLVIDEADTLFDESFESAITSILKEVKVYFYANTVAKQSLLLVVQKWVNK